MVYIDHEGLIRGAYAQIEEIETKIDLLNHYIINAISEITPEEGQAIGTDVLPFTITIDDGSRRNYNEEMFFPEVYENLMLDKSVCSFPVTVESFLNAFRKAPEDKPIIVLVVSKRYSEGFNNAIKAKKLLAKENPDKAKNVLIVDSKTTDPLMKLMMKNAISMDEEGKSLEEIINYLNWVREKHISYIYIDSLTALRKSECVRRVTTFFGNLLGLKPVIIENMNNNGDLKAFKTVRSKE